MPAATLRELLDREGVRYVVIRHSPAYTADAIAACAHIPLDEMVKAVMVNIDGQLAMTVLPANEDLDLAAVRDYLDAQRLVLASEREFGDTFPDCEIGAMPPFGALYGVPTYAMESVTDHDVIAFNAGTHRECMTMDVEEYLRLARPKILHPAAWHH